MACSVALIAVGCTSSPTNFASMSEEELYAYNMDRPILEQVYCRVEKTTSSFIRKRRCATVQQLVDQVNNSTMALDVLDYGGNFNAGLRSRD